MSLGIQIYIHVNLEMSSWVLMFSCKYAHVYVNLKILAYIYTCDLEDDVMDPNVYIRMHM